MGVPDAVKEKLGDMKDVSGLSKDELAALVKQYYDQSCAIFGEKFDMEHQVKVRIEHASRISAIRLNSQWQLCFLQKYKCNILQVLFES